MSKTIVVVPCFNEAARLSSEGFAPLLARADTDLLFVDDGSTDDTAEVVQAFCDKTPGRARLLSLEQNQGKGQAVRHGLLAALDDGADIVGYIDADLSTPASEVTRLIDRMEQTDAAVVIASRVVLMGADIHRRPARHYLGRVFATAASFVLKAPVYDTQCGAKFFRASQALRDVLADPFVSRWAFDVELLGRILTSSGFTHDSIIEMPIQRWVDVAGSKLTGGGMARAGVDLVAIALRLRKRRRENR